MKFMAVADVPLPTFMLGWYGGAFITVTTMLLMRDDNNIADFRGQLNQRKDFGLMFIIALFIMLNTWLSYWAFQLAPLTVVQPMFFVEQMVIPALIGLFCFDEKKEFSWREWISFVIAVAGTVIVIASYS